MPNKTTIRGYFCFHGLYVPQLNREIRTVSSSAGSGFTVKSLFLPQQGWDRGDRWPWDDRSGFSIPLLPGKDIWHSVGWKSDWTHSVSESLDDKLPVKDILGHSRPVKKSPQMWHRDVSYQLCHCHIHENICNHKTNPAYHSNTWMMWGHSESGNQGSVLVPCSERFPQIPSSSEQCPNCQLQANLNGKQHPFIQ